MNFIPKSKTGKSLLLAFFSGTTYFTYDRYQYSIIQKDLESKLKYFGSLPINASDPSDKLKIYIAPSFYALNWFNSYIRPFLYIGGMDYELVQKELNEIHEDLVVTIKNLRKNWNYKTVKVRNRTWMEYFRGISAPTIQVLETNNEFKGIIGIGSEVYNEISSGYNHGLNCFKEECDQDCSNLESSNVSTNQEQNYPFLLEILGKEQTGWSGFPKRIFWAFHQRWILEQIGGELIELFKKIEDLEKDFRK